MIPNRDQELAVLRSVVYASLFDYPLTLDQLHQSLIGIRAEKESIAAWWRSSELLQTAIECRDGLFFPAGRADLIATRSRREMLSRDLLDRDRRILSMVSRMPFVRMVALSGSLAHLNAEGSADLDLFMITAPGRVWSVTLAVLVLSRVFGWRRHLCLNYVISENTMKIVPEDLFTANQIIHLRPTYGRDVFARFLYTNQFVRNFYPNFELKTDLKTSRPQGLKTLFERVLAIGLAPLAERFARAFYGWHLRRKSASWQSRDEVRLDAECLKLHTSSHRTKTLETFEDATAALLSTKDTKDTKHLEVLAS